MQDFMTIARKSVRILNNLCKRAKSVRIVVLERHTMHIMRTLLKFAQYGVIVLTFLEFS